MEIRVNVSKVEEIALLEREFKMNPSSVLAKKALVAVGSMSICDMPASPLIVLGLFLKKYKEAFHKAYDGKVWFLYKDIERIVNVRGMEDAYKGVEVLFSTSMRWVKGGKLSFLLDDSKFFDYVVPNMKGRSKGEQAEWKGPVTPEKGYQVVRL